MKQAIVSLVRCPACGGDFALEATNRDGDEVHAGALSCNRCSASFRLADGVPLFVPEQLSREVSQVQVSYSSKWNRVPYIYDEGSFGTQHQREWYLARYHWGDEQQFARFLAEKTTILDAGCGLGRDVRWYATLQPSATVIGADLSEGVFHAYEKSVALGNVSLIQADLNKLPFAPETFDFVACDQVLPCVEDPRAAVERLWSLVRPGGHFAFYVYKQKSPIREFSDDFLRDRITRMGPEEAWEASANITRLGKALSDLQIEFEVPSDIPELEIKAGSYNLQRFFYYHVLKCFWNDGMSFDENNLVNFDWFHPAYTYRHPVAEVEEWTRALGMEIAVLDTEDPSGISVLAQKV
jgi:ubiquinone/menaquinone biosynthesis C-methylase UbiE/uncharacterized protein YbaR (Trm112 family)